MRLATSDVRFGSKADICSAATMLWLSVTTLTGELDDV